MKLLILSIVSVAAVHIVVFFLAEIAWINLVRSTIGIKWDNGSTHNYVVRKRLISDILKVKKVSYFLFLLFYIEKYFTLAMKILYVSGLILGLAIYLVMTIIR